MKHAGAALQASLVDHPDFCFGRAAEFQPQVPRRPHIHGEPKLAIRAHASSRLAAHLRLQQATELPAYSDVIGNYGEQDTALSMIGGTRKRDEAIVPCSP